MQGYSVGEEPTRHSVNSRPFRDDGDFQRVRRLLVETHRTTPVGFNWEVRRWDGWRYYDPDPSFKPEWRESVRLWETGSGLLVGAVHPEGKGSAHLQVHPKHRYLEYEMVAWAEEHLAVHSEKHGFRYLDIFVFEYDTLRQDLLGKRGFEKTDRGGVVRHRRLGETGLPGIDISQGYAIRTVNTDDPNDCIKIAGLLNAAFGRDFHNAEEFRTFTRYARCYRSDLDLVAVTAEDEFAAYVGVPYDSDNCAGIFEPVCTHPDHLRRGLARALMIEGLRRLTAIGATDVQVETGDREAANRLYDAIGFEDVYRGTVWRKRL